MKTWHRKTIEAIRSEREANTEGFYSRRTTNHSVYAWAEVYHNFSVV